MSVIVQSTLDGGLVRVSIGRRRLLRVVFHDRLRLFSCCAHAALLLDGLLLLRVVVDLFAQALGAVRRREAGADRLNHLRKPEDVEEVQSDVGGKVRGTEPKRQVAQLHKGRGLANGV